MPQGLGSEALAGPLHREHTKASLSVCSMALSHAPHPCPALHQGKETQMVLLLTEGVRTSCPRFSSDVRALAPLPALRAALFHGG